jgi:L-amino acid N-acyltransferase YncA
MLPPGSLLKHISPAIVVVSFSATQNQPKKINPLKNKFSKTAFKWFRQLPPAKRCFWVFVETMRARGELIGFASANPINPQPGFAS